MTLTTRPTRIWRALFLASLLAFPAVSFAAAPASRRARAQAAYKRAVRMRTTLASRPADTRLKADYEKVIKTFRLVHWYDPSYTKTPPALQAVGELYAEMGRRFSSNYYYEAAIRAYEYLLSQYPRASMSREGLFAIGEIYLSDLGQPEAARETFQRYLKKYSRFAKASEARAKLEQIDRLMAERAASQAREEARRHAGSMPQVTAIRQWVGPSYTRIVVNVEGEVKFETTRLPDPDRIVLDLIDSRLSSSLVGKTFPVEDGFLRQVRVGQFQPTITRVVLDVEKIEDYSIFSLPNPFRLVIDINGPRPAAAKKVVAKSKTAPAAASKEEATKAEAVKPKPSPSKSAGKETASARPPPLPPSQPAKLVSKPPEQEALPPIKPAAPTQAGSRTLTRALGLKIARIVIDPGHGGHDTGTIGPTGVAEKDVVLDVALKLKELVEEKMGAEVVMTRTNDTFIPLEERTAIANENAADLFISIHANASRDRRARGIETYFLNFTSNPEALEVAARENATSQESVHKLQDLIKKIAMTEKIEESQEFATQVHREVYRRLVRTTRGQRDRGVKKAPFVVLIGANMPSILAEVSFLTNPSDERLLKRGDYRQNVADALYRGIARYAENLGGVRATQEASARETSTAGASNF